MQTIVLASNNAGKLTEFQQLFAPLAIDIIPQDFFGTTEAEETGQTFIENALIKARHAALHTKRPALADDSGLVIDALQGAPGIYSARYSGKHGDAQANCQKVLDELRDVPLTHRTAYFHCSLVYLRHASDPEPLIVSANWYGSILPQAIGEQGFGYDPIFFVPEQQCSAAQLPAILKNQLSHRAQALQKFMALFNSQIAANS